MGFRFLMASDFYSPFIGGAERQIQLLGRELVIRGHSVQIVTGWHAELAEQEDDAGVDVRRLKGFWTQVPWFSKDPTRRFHPPFPDPFIVRKVRQIIKEFQPDLVHAQGWIAYSCAVALLGTNIPFLVTARDTGYTCATRSLMYHGRVCDGPLLLKCLECAAEQYGTAKSLAAVVGIYTGRVVLNSKATAIHGVSTFLNSLIKRDLLFDRKNTATIGTHLIADIAVVSARRESVRITDLDFLDRLPKEPFLLYVGALQSNKGINVLLDAYKQLVSPPPLVLIGTVWADTPHKFPPGVVVFHNLPHAYVMFAFEQCLFGIVPSILPDALPGVVREAMSMKKAVIGTRVGGIVDMINDGVTGLLIPPGDVDALVRAMQVLIDNAELREKLGSAGQQDVERYKPDHVVPQFEALYSDLIYRSREIH